jgi:hypothetical protein
MAPDVKAIVVEIAKVSLRKGDLLIVKVPPGCSQQIRDQVHRELKAMQSDGALNGAHYIVADHGFDFVQGQGPAHEAPAAPPAGGAPQ